MVSDDTEFIGTTSAPPSGDRVELTDLEVIQRWSLAVRGASAERSEVVAALRADLAWLERGRTPARETTATPQRAAASSAVSTPRTQPARQQTAARTPVKAASRTPARPATRTASKATKTATRTTAKKAAKKKPAKRSSSARGGAR